MQDFLNLYPETRLLFLNSLYENSANERPECLTLLHAVQKMEDIIEECDNPTEKALLETKIARLRSKQLRAINRMVKKLREMNLPIPANTLEDIKFCNEARACLGIGQKEKISAGKVLRSPQQFLAAMKAEKLRQQLEKITPEERAQKEEALLKMDLASRPQQSKKVRNKKKKKKKKKSGKTKYQAIQSSAKVGSAAENGAAKTAQRIDSRNQWIHQMLNPTTSIKNSYLLAERVSRWDDPNLTAEDVATWESHQERSIKALRWQVTNHIGIGIEKFLNDPSFYEEFVFESERGPMLWVTIHTKNGQHLQGKLHLGIATLPTGRKLIYHRHVTLIKEGHFSGFIAQDAPEGLPEEEMEKENARFALLEASLQAGGGGSKDESIEEMEMISGFRAEDVAGNIKVTQSHKYITGFTLHKLT